MKKKKLTKAQPHAHTKSKSGRKAIDPKDKKVQVTLYTRRGTIDALGGYARVLELCDKAIGNAYFHTLDLGKVAETKSEQAPDQVSVIPTHPDTTYNPFA